MGHTHVGPLPKSAEWKAVLERLVSGYGLASDDVPVIAEQTLKALGQGLDNAPQDASLQVTAFTLAKLIIAIRQLGPQDLLAKLGLDKECTVFDLASAMQSSTDESIRKQGDPTDISEVAQQAAVEALLALADEQGTPLFSGGAGEIHVIADKLKTKVGLARISQLFFASLITRYLDFYLSRLTAASVGTARLPTIVSVTEFNASLRSHCDQSAHVVGSFFARWHDRTGLPEELTQQTAARFASIALTKLRREMDRRGGQS